MVNLRFKITTLYYLTVNTNNKLEHVIYWITFGKTGEPKRTLKRSPWHRDYTDNDTKNLVWRIECCKFFHHLHQQESCFSPLFHRKECPIVISVVQDFSVPAVGNSELFILNHILRTWRIECRKFFISTSRKAFFLYPVPPQRLSSNIFPSVRLVILNLFSYWIIFWRHLPRNRYKFTGRNIYYLFLLCSLFYFFSKHIHIHNVCNTHFPSKQDHYAISKPYFVGFVSRVHHMSCIGTTSSGNACTIAAISCRQKSTSNTAQRWRGAHMRNIRC